VPVKVNAQANPEIAEQYGVHSWPTDVVLDADGQILHGGVCPQDARQYMLLLDRVATTNSRRQEQQLAAAGSAGRAARTSWSRQPEAVAEQPQVPEQRVAERAPPQDALADYDQYDRRAARRQDSPAAERQATQPPPRAQLTGSQPLRQQNPPLALDGHCPVHLVNTTKWVRGDVRWGAIHRGRTYLFTTQQCQQAFLANPDFYSPVLSGNDPVAAVDDGRLVPGQREYGVTFIKPEICEGQIYLFSSEATRAIFEQNPDRYAAAVSRMR
jgi:protein disulfide-isomerase